jgi:hypothetical protein
VAPLAGLTALQSLSLAGTRVGIVAPLAGLTALRTLDLSNAQASGVLTLAHIRGLLIDGDPIHHALYVKCWELAGQLYGA